MPLTVDDAVTGSMIIIKGTLNCHEEEWEVRTYIFIRGSLRGACSTLLCHFRSSGLVPDHAACFDNRPRPRKRRDSSGTVHITSGKYGASDLHIELRKPTSLCRPFNSLFFQGGPAALDWLLRGNASMASCLTLQSASTSPS